MADGLGAIDWAAPWLAGWREHGERLSRCPGPLHARLNAAPGVPIRFAPAHDCPAGVAYETHVFNTRRCPTRDNAHDFFNGLCWLRFPAIKRRLNALQAARIAHSGTGPVRGPLGDALTLLDESGAFLQAPAPLWEALQARQWRRLFVDLRPLWREARLTLFGHALLEQLLQPRKGITAHVYLVREPALAGAGRSVAGMDDAWAGDLEPAHLATKPFTPLPVLGVPGWWPENQNFSFYDDSLVFRPRRLPIAPEQQGQPRTPPS